ncbi:MAG: hypothetical protein ACI31C_03130 [Muribaculaceae bacterium]
MDLYINSCDDDFAAVAVIRQFYDISFAEARDLVIDLPKKLPDLPVERFGELFAQLSAVGVTLSTGQPLPQQKPEPEPEPEHIYQPEPEPAPEPSMSMQEMFGLFKDAFANFSNPQPAQKPAPSTKVITDIGSKEITDVGNDCGTGTGEISESDPAKTPGQWYIQIDDAGPVKLAIVKVIKETLDIGLREAMDFVSVIPTCHPLPNLNEFQVKNLVDKLVRNGAKASAHFL